MAARPLARALKAELPGVRIALSSTTDTGHEVALAALANGEIECAFYFPLDLPPILRRVVGALRPDAIGFVETELWPNLLHIARQRGIETFQLNGRVSDNLLRTAPRLGPLWKWMSGNVSRFLMRGETDAARLRSLGVAPEKIAVVGDVKLEAPAVSSAGLRRKWREELALGGAKLLIAGSSHSGEEALILDAMTNCIGWKLALAPRHIERADEVAAEIEASGYKVARRSRGENFWFENTVFLLDSVGELAEFYAAADLAFVGGSLVPRGGHNVLEPVLRGVPALFGPHMMNFRAAAELVIENELGAQIEDGQSLRLALAKWGQLAGSEAFAARVEAALGPHAGAGERAAGWVARAVRERRKLRLSRLSERC